MFADPLGKFSVGSGWGEEVGKEKRLVMWGWGDIHIYPLLFKKTALAFMIVKELSK